MDMNKNERDKLDKSLKHEKYYDTEIEYRAVLAYERVMLDMTMEIFLKNPSVDEYMALERCMLHYQDIVCNCTWKRGDE